MLNRHSELLSPHQSINSTVLETCDEGQQIVLLGKVKRKGGKKRCWIFFLKNKESWNLGWCRKSLMLKLCLICRQNFNLYVYWYGGEGEESVTALFYTNNCSKTCPFCCGNSSVFLSIIADIPGSLKYLGIYNLSTVILYMSKPVADLAVLRLLPCDN